MRQLAGVIACCCLVLACARPSTPAAKQAPPPEEAAPTPGGPEIVIGAYLPLTGAEGSFGVAVSQGIELAVEQQNQAGGVRGRRIVLRTLDTEGRIANAPPAVSRLVTGDGAVAILGEVSSRMSLAGAMMAQELGVPMISPSATHPEVTRVGDMIFRVCAPDEMQGIAMATFARARLKAARAAVLYDAGQPYSSGLAAVFDRTFSRLGGTIATTQTFSDAVPDLQAQLEAIRDAKVDAIFAPLYYSRVGPIVRKLRELGVTAPMLGTDGWDSPELGASAGPAIDGSYYTNHFAADDPRPIAQGLAKRHRARFGGEPDALAALGYDTARLLFAAMARARSLSGKDLAAAIASTNGFHGATGSLVMGPDREPKKSIAILQLKAGKRALVEMVLPPP